MTTQHDDWMFSKIYVGAVEHGLEYLATDAIPAAVAAAAPERWFYMRYADPDGLHIRLRMRDGRGPAALRALIEPVIKAHLARVPTIAPTGYRPVARHPGAHSLAAGTRMFAGVVWDRYEPETAKFGVAGMDIAEALFQASSELAVATLRADAAGELSRKTLAPIYMAQTLEVLGAPQPAAAFWRDYSLFWLGGEGVIAAQWRDRFAAKGRELARSGVPIVAPRTQLGPVELGLIDRWGAALERARAAYDAAKPPLLEVQAKVAFHMAHLTNNRLGFSPLEEAYFAALLETSEPLEAVA